MPQLYWIVPLEGGHPDNSLPGGPPGHVGGGPIYHPGHPSHGLPSSPGHPANRPPGSGGGHPGNALPDGEDVEISNELPEVPSEYEDKVVVAVKRPGQEWTVKAYDPNSGIDNSLPPTPEPK